jgi:hypothetical protein
MNTKTKILSFIVMFAIAILVGSCKKDSILNPYGNCDNLAIAVSTAASNFSSNPTVANCEAYKDALQDYVNGCAGYTLYNAAYQDAINDLDCSDYNQ